VVSLFAAIGVVLLFVAVQALMFGVLGGDVSVDDTLDAHEALLLGVIQVAGIVVVVGLAALGVLRGREALALGSGSQVRAGLLALVTVGVFVVLPTVGAALANGDRLIDHGVGPVDAAAFVLLACLIAVNEELWFRGLVVHVLGGRARPWWTVVVAPLVFGLPHYTGDTASLLNAIAVTLAVGVPFVVVRLRYQALLPLMFWHAVIDAWAFLHTSSVVAEGSPSIDELLVALIVPSLLAIGYVLWFRGTADRPAR
jgi:membrane protease YdiL (CAAX protease family)